MDKDNSLNGEKYIELGMILKRTRSEEDKKKVSDILEMDIPIEEKRMKIEEIDRATREQRIKARFQQLLSSNLDPRISMHMNNIQRDLTGKMGDVKKDLTYTHILLVDDLTYITRTVSYMLQKEEFRVFTAKNAAEGIMLFQSIVPDLVITDIRLPDFNGIELATLIRRLDETVPIIFITALEMDMKNYDLGKGKMAYLQKPILKEVLLETIHQLLNDDAQPK